MYKPPLNFVVSDVDEFSMAALFDYLVFIEKIVESVCAIINAHRCRSDTNVIQCCSCEKKHPEMIYFKIKWIEQISWEGVYRRRSFLITF